MLVVLFFNKGCANSIEKRKKMLPKKVEKKLTKIAEKTRKKLKKEGKNNVEK